MKKPPTLKPGTKFRIYGEDWVVCQWQSGAATDEIAIAVRPMQPKRTRRKPTSK